MYYLFIVILENCPFSENVVKLCERHNINFKSLKITLNEKDNYKTADIKTFPQVYLKKDNTKDSLLLGGFSDFNNFINTFHKKYDQKDLINFQKQYSLWNKKSILRVIEIINK
jgi:glutaredoxin-related protein